MRKIIDSVFRNIVVWFSLILVSFLAVVSFLFTSVFEWDESNQYLPEVIHYKSDIFIITLAVCVFIIFYLFRRVELKCYFIFTISNEIFRTHFTYQYENFFDHKCAGIITWMDFSDSSGSGCR